MHTEKRKEAELLRDFIVGIKKNWAEESNLIYKNKKGVIMSTIGIREKKVVYNNIGIQ